MRAFATAATKLQIVWWSDNSSSIVERYFVSCYYHPLTENQQVVEHNVTMFYENAINTIAFHQLIPLTKYTCCVVEYLFDNTTTEACTNVTTHSLVSCQSANGKNDDYSTISYVQESMLRLL